MDNNFNQGQPNQGQPVQPTQAQYAQQPAQPQYSQQPNDPFGNQYSQPKQPPKFNLFELIGIICSGVGMLLVFFGTIFTCTCSADYKAINKAGGYTMSPVFILTIIGIIAAIAGVAISIIAIKDTKSAVKAGNIAKIAAGLGVFAVIYGILPTVTICGYNCNLNNMQEEAQGDFMDSLDDLSDYFN